MTIGQSEPFAGVLFVIISQLHLDWSGAMYGVRTEKMYLALSPCSLQTLKIGACNMIRCAVVKWSHSLCTISGKKRCVPAQRARDVAGSTLSSDRRFSIYAFHAFGSLVYFPWLLEVWTRYLLQILWSKLKNEEEYDSRWKLKPDHSTKNAMDARKKPIWFFRASRQGLDKHKKKAFPQIWYPSFTDPISERLVRL